MSKMIKTNMGVMPLEDYLDIRARQCGFDDYEDLKRNGYDVEYSETDCQEENEDTSAECNQKVLSDEEVKEWNRLNEALAEAARLLIDDNNEETNKNYDDILHRLLQFARTHGINQDNL